MKYVSIILKCIALGLVMAAGSLWAGAEVDTRPKYRDEQTLVGGAVWTQTIIPIGLIISAVIDEEINVFVHVYFVFAGALLLIATGSVLTIGEMKSMHRRRRITNMADQEPPPTYDKIYFGIGILSLLSGLFTLADLFAILIYY